MEYINHLTVKIVGSTESINIDKELFYSLCDEIEQAVATGEQKITLFSDLESIFSPSSTVSTKALQKALLLLYVLSEKFKSREDVSFFSGVTDYIHNYVAKILDRVEEDTASLTYIFSIFGILLNKPLDESTEKIVADFFASNMFKTRGDVATCRFYIQSLKYAARSGFFLMFHCFLRQTLKREEISLSEFSRLSEFYEDVYDGESDPRLILSLFRAFEYIAQIHKKNLATLGKKGTESLDNAIEVVKLYFPLNYDPPGNSDMGITKELLLSTLARAISTSPMLFANYFGSYIIENLTSKIEDTKLQSVTVLSHIDTETILVYETENQFGIFQQLLESTEKFIFDKAFLKAALALIRERSTWREAALENLSELPKPVAFPAYGTETQEAINKIKIIYTLGDYETLRDFSAGESVLGVLNTTKGSMYRVYLVPVLHYTLKLGLNLGVSDDAFISKVSQPLLELLRDLTESLDKDNVSKVLKKTLKLFSVFLRLWRPTNEKESSTIVSSILAITEYHLESDPAKKLRKGIVRYIASLAGTELQLEIVQKLLEKHHNNLDAIRIFSGISVDETVSWRIVDALLSKGWLPHILYYFDGLKKGTRLHLRDDQIVSLGRLMDKSLAASSEHDWVSKRILKFLVKENRMGDVVRIMLQLAESEDFQCIVLGVAAKYSYFAPGIEDYFSHMSTRYPGKVLSKGMAKYVASSGREDILNGLSVEDPRYTFLHAYYYRLLLEDDENSEQFVSKFSLEILPNLDARHLDLFLGKALTAATPASVKACKEINALEIEDTDNVKLTVLLSYTLTLLLKSNESINISLDPSNNFMYLQKIFLGQFGIPEFVKFLSGIFPKILKFRAVSNLLEILSFVIENTAEFEDFTNLIDLMIKVSRNKSGEYLVNDVEMAVNCLGSLVLVPDENWIHSKKSFQRKVIKNLEKVTLNRKRVVRVAARNSVNLWHLI